MISYNKLIEKLPEEMQFPIMKILEQFREDLLDTVTKADFKRLENVVSALGDKTLELAEAQKRTELRVEELAEAQKRTELRVEELAEAQKRTEETLREVVKKQDRMAKELGGLSTSFGYFLENEAIAFLPEILKKKKGIDIQVMDRRYIVYADGKDDEINIYGEGLEEGKKVYVIGESKSQFGKKDADRFQKLLQRVSAHVRAKVYPLIVTHSVHPTVEAYAKKVIPDLEIYKSYEMKVKRSEP
jgi:hypothetical protein